MIRFLGSLFNRIQFASLLAGRVKKEAGRGVWLLKSETARPWFSPDVQVICNVPIYKPRFVYLRVSGNFTTFKIIWRQSTIPMELREFIKKHFLKIITFIGFVAATLYSIHIHRKDKEFIEKNTRYVIGQITGVKTTTHGQIFDYEYRFANQLYKNRKQYNIKDEDIGKRFLVMVSAEKPEKSRILLEEYIPSTSSLVQPDSGWGIIPK